MKEETATAFLRPAADVFVPPRQDKEQEQIERNRGGGVAAWLVGVSFTGDVAAVVAALFLAFGIRFHTPVGLLGRTADAMSLASYRGHFIFLSVTLLLILFYNDLYGSGRPQRLRKVNAIIVMSTLLWFLGNVGLSFELNTNPIVSRLFLACACLCATGTLTLWRWGFDQFLARPAVAARLQRRILFVGWSEQAVKMVEHIVGDPKHPYRIVGCVPSSPRGEFDMTPPETVPRLGAYADLRTVLAENDIDIAIVADLNPTRGSLRDMVTVCEKEIVHLQIVPSCFQVLCSGLHMETTSGVPVLGISRLPLDSPWHQMLKRAIDIVGALVGLVLSAPLIAVFCAIVYMESPGPVFFRQRRLGLGGKVFYIVKIRSMRLNAEGGGLYTKRDDPRRLKIGALMRAWNVDEVPQFWNVLVGDMSLVGPRPELEKMIVSLKEEVPHYNARHGVKPGLTGWAQVNGFRGDTDLTERIKCDLYYMENWNLLLDVQIMLMTFFTRANAM